MEFYLWDALEAGLIDAINEACWRQCCCDPRSSASGAWAHIVQEGRNWIASVSQAFAAETWEMRGFSSVRRALRRAPHLM